MEERGMKKKLLIELIIYVILAIIGIILLFTYKPEKEPINIPSDFIITVEGVKNDVAIHDK